MTPAPTRPFAHTRRLLAAASALMIGMGVAATSSDAPAHAVAPPADGVFYVLEARQGYLNRPIAAGIRQVTYDERTNSISADNILLGGELIDLPVKDGTSNLLRDNANALGVSSDGMFYFTTQLGSESQVGTIDIWSVELVEAPSEAHPQGVLGTPTRVAENFQLNSRGGGNINGGAVNPRDGAYYFMYLSNFTSETSATSAGVSDPSRWAEAVRAHLYRYDPHQVSLGNVATGEVAHIDFFKNSAVNLALPQLLNGDITFDSSGNLILVTSVLHDATKSGGPGPAMMATFDYADFGHLPNIDPREDARPVPTIAPAATIGAAGQPTVYNAHAGAAYNGLAFTRSGKLIVEQGNTHTITNPVDFSALGPNQANGVKSPDVSWVDLATHTGPPTLSVQVDLQTDRGASEQFTISGTQTLGSGSVHTFEPATTSGTGRGLQAARIGALPILADGTLDLSLDATGPISRFAVTVQCTTGVGDTAFASASASQISLKIADAPATATMGAQISCVFTVRDQELAATGLSTSGLAIGAGALALLAAGGVLLAVRTRAIRRPH
ncbi:hypothetical protein [Salinibacterium sp. ZJ77]|uniref:hypothetical protein n=1 Tax=Salinibacterium sp. ZJ77 TaxID=2708337 RepID=UPI0014214E97|nr:hypothetical protein [Salinibacterium sp. ZJ77]